MTTRSVTADITVEDGLHAALEELIKKMGRLDGLVNDAADNPKMETRRDTEFSRLERFSRTIWDADIAVEQTGAYLCCKVLGIHLASNSGGVIINIASDLGIIDPDQRIYRKEGLPDDRQPVKPVTYSVVTHGLVGFTLYCATYWCDRGVRVDTLCPDGVYNEQPEEFVSKLRSLIPLGRMVQRDEYLMAIQFLCSDAFSYMTGSCRS